MRKQTYLDQRQSDNHERWLVSYSDFVTLLLAFFVMMYAVSSVSEANYRAVSDSLGSAFRNRPRSEYAGATVERPVALPNPQPIVAMRMASQRRQQEKMEGMARNIMHVLAPLVDEGKVRVTHSRLGVTVEINASVLFAPGQVAIKESSSRTLQAVAQLLKEAPHAIQVEGHTDNVSIRTPTYPSNWELSTARASSVVRLLVDAGVEATRLTALGFGEYRPLEFNDTAEGRARNRRVMMRVLFGEPERVMEIPVRPTSAAQK
jgi:chemotaxis protein MotB